jgi:hypothetical protein
MPGGDLSLAIRDEEESILMPNSQSEFPLTLAEVLFEEFEATRGTASGPEWEAIEKEIEEIENEIEKIRDLPTFARKRIEQVWVELKMKGEASDEELSNLIWKCKKEISKTLVPRLYRIIRRRPGRLSALCLSGGGVRSAVFNLGILQGLARCGLLDKFDYLSTVSGGGFIGSWLTGWIYRQVPPTEKELPVTTVASRLKEAPKNPLKPEPSPLYNLRIYANYLTPRKGLLSVDSWTLVAVYLRNLMLNWLVFLPVILALLMLPRIWVAFVRTPYFGTPLGLKILLWAGFGTAAISLAYIGTNLPGAKLGNLRESNFVFFCLTPLVLSAMALTTYWVRLGTYEKPGRWQFAVFALLLGAGPWSLYIFLKIIAYLRDKKEIDDEGFRRNAGALRTIGFYALATVLILAAFAITGWVTWYVVRGKSLTELDPVVAHARVYATLAVPLLLILLTVGGTLIAGFTSRFTDVDDQEWWARCGAWILIVVLGWMAAHILVLLGPSVFVDLQTQLLSGSNPGPTPEPHSFADCCAFLTSQKTWSGANLKGVITAIVGAVSGAITLFGGYSPKTSAQGELKPEAGWKSKVLSIGTSAAAVIFGAFIVILLALCTDWILASSFGDWTSRHLGGLALSMNANDPREIIYKSPGRMLVALSIGVGLVGWILGRFINTNRFSLHYYWRNRMMRAYLGPTRDDEERAKTKNKFTDFDLADNLQMYEVKQKPLHVVNVTLNLAGGDKLEWQDRKAESFSISPLHCGSYWLGYRNSRDYGGDNGISLATSVAISGAAASPNMGYMMTSPVVRFIMTLFNIRLGFWLGNPGVAGSGDPSTFNQTTYDRASPTQSVRPIFAEALGMTNDKSPYVYLSDGGHFDNFGLYEMILRRCRFIVVSDASTDPTYCFESLAYAIRQVRIDFGVPIELRNIDRGEKGEKRKKEDKITGMHFDKEPKKENRYCAVFDIKYSCVDKLQGPVPDPDYDGVLIYIKPSLNGSEPADVLNYHKADTDFPEDTIADQWFSESQFESYRMLGSHMIETIGSIVLPDTQEERPALQGLDEFEAQAELHVKARVVHE